MTGNAPDDFYSSDFFAAVRPSEVAALRFDPLACRGLCFTHCAHTIEGHIQRSIDMQLTDEELDDIRARLYEMQVEHRDLHLVIEHLGLNPPPDQLLVRRLKKRKLQLKDRIAQLERMLVPDIPA